MYIGNTPAENYASFLTETFTVSATANYTLSHAVTNENEIRLVINGVVQQPGSGKAYTASGTTLTLTSATVSGDSMYAVYLGRALQTVNPPNASVGTSQLGSSLDFSSKTITLSNNMKNTPSFRAFRNGSQTVADVTSTVVQFNGESFDTDSAYDTSNYRFTVPSGKAGKYLFSAHIYIWQGSASLYSCDFQIRKNGANQSFNQLGLDSSDNYSYVPNSTAILDLSVGDYVDVTITGNTNDGGSFTVFGNSPYNYSVFQGYKLIG